MSGVLPLLLACLLAGVCACFVGKPSALEAEGIQGVVKSRLPMMRLAKA